MIYFFILFFLNLLAIVYFIFRTDDDGNKFTLRDAFNFTTNNSEKVFTVIIIFMLVFLSFMKITLQIFSEHYSIETEEWKNLNLAGIEISLPASMYITVVALVLAMLLIHSNKIIHYYIVHKFSVNSISIEQPEVSNTIDLPKQNKNLQTDIHYSNINMSGKE